MMTPAEALSTWVKQHKNYTQITPIPGDASSRHYFRVTEKDATYIAVYAPPASENNEAFVEVAKRFLKQGLNVPEVLQVNYREGFLLLSDLGDTQLLKVLNHTNVKDHYSKALEDLIKLQGCRNFSTWQLPHFDSRLLSEELSRFDEWYLDKHLAITLSESEHAMLKRVYDLLIEQAEGQPQVCVHRDYHSRNLMLLPNNEIGILDFQDAVLGPITYDLVSLLRDCYIKWPPEQVYEWVEEFWQVLHAKQMISVSLSQFITWFDWMGLQRHLKVLGIFARLYRRDNKTIYLCDMPLVLEYVLFVCDKYSEFTALKEFLLKRVKPT
ncbi:MAG: phosphotransferase [Gammaproteobacteria bacterium]|nr:phosphotransferase [Gammaproteobacteria bacterium]